MEVIDSVIFGQLIVDIETCLKEVFKELKFLSFPVKCGQRCCLWLWQFGSSVDIIVKVRRIVIICQLLKSWSASIVAGVFSLRNCGWLVERFFFCFPQDVLGGQYVTSSWAPVILWQIPICSVAPVTMSWRSSGPEFCVIWSWRGRLQDEDHSGSRRRSFPGFYLMRSGMAPELFRSVPVVAGS